MGKQKYIAKTEQVLCEIYFLQNCTKDASENKLPHSHLERNLQTIYMRLFTLCSYLKTKESYDRWVTRRVWGFRHQISKAKYLKKSVGNIRKLQEKFHCTVQNGDLVVSIIRVCFLIVGGNGSDESRVSDEPSCQGNLNCRLRMLSG